MIRSALVMTAALLCGTAPVHAGQPRLTTDDDKTLYSMGLNMGQGLATLRLTSKELALVQRGIADAATRTKPAVDPHQYPRKKIDALLEARAAAITASNKAKGEAFAAKAAKEKGAVTFDDGMVFTELRTGSGPAPSPASYVTVRFRGTLTDGTEIDNTYTAAKPTGLPLGPSIIPCWAKGLQRMKPGGKARFVCPPSLAFGDLGRSPDVPPGSTLIYEFDLLAAENR